METITFSCSEGVTSCRVNLVPDLWHSDKFTLEALQAMAANGRDNEDVGTSGREHAFGDSQEPPERIGKKLMIRRSDHIRLLQQALHKLGYKAVAHRLEEESVSGLLPTLPLHCFRV